MEFLMNKQPTFTQTLMRLIRKTLADMAAEDFRSAEASGALFEASREIGKRHVELVTRAREAAEWQRQLRQQEGSTNVG
jgi:hypothetical protein